MTTVVIAGVKGTMPPDTVIEQQELGSDVIIRTVLFDGNHEALLSDCREADAILNAYVPFDAAIIRQLKNCRVISMCATGYENIDMDAAKTAGISVCALEGYCTDEVADHALLLMLALSRRLTEYHHQVQVKAQWQFDSLNGLKRLRGQTLGIIGFGLIGKAVATRAVAFGLSVLVCDPYADKQAASDQNVIFTDLDSLLAASDIISLHCNLTPDNTGFLNAAAFGKMTKRPILINVARGALIDEQALVAALDTGSVSAAGLDVLATESPDLEKSELRGRANVILTPHMAFYSDSSIYANRQIAARNIRHSLDGNHTAVQRYIHHATTSNI